ncbi:MAG: DNA-binding protein WhiA [Clostridia bacterium]|nr:DNA-binding protein WhiA [Clostridia bacterium]
MSFSSTVKEELIGISIKNSCCRRALLYGFLLGAEIVDGNILVSTEVEAVALHIAKLIREFFGKEPTIESKVCFGRQKYFLCFESTRILKFLHSLDLSEEDLISLLGKTCGTCPQVFLRGAFLVFGTVNDPAKSYHAEFLIPRAARAEKLDAFLAELGIPARRILRAKKIGLYYKSSSAMEELFAELGGSRAVFDLINVKIERELRNNENRATNCDARNIAKMVSASQKQIAAIIALKDCGMLESLEEDLQKTAELRMEHDEVSLSELAALHEPPISKSGLNHRLAKLCELAEKIK